MQSTGQAPTRTSFVKARTGHRCKAAGALALALSCLASADHQTPLAALSMSSTQSIAFGAFAAGSGGSVIVSPTGARSSTGGVVLISASDGAPAQFTVSGDPSFTYSITLPSDGTVTLANGLGHSMEVGSFTSSPSLAGQLNLSGSQQLAVGATLHVSSSQPAGNYSSSFPVTVNYD